MSWRSWRTRWWKVEPSGLEAQHPKTLCFFFHLHVLEESHGAVRIAGIDQQQDSGHHVTAKDVHSFAHSVFADVVGELIHLGTV